MLVDDRSEFWCCERPNEATKLIDETGFRGAPSRVAQSIAVIGCRTVIAGCE